MALVVPGHNFNDPLSQQRNTELVPFDASKNQQIVVAKTPLSNIPPNFQSSISDAIVSFNNTVGFPSNADATPNTTTVTPSESLKRKWQNKDFLESLEHAITTEEDISLNISIWDKDTDREFIQSFVTFCKGILNSIRTESGNYETMTAEDVTNVVPNFIKDIIGKHKGLKNLNFITQIEKQQPFWEWVGEPNRRKQQSRIETEAFITGKTIGDTKPPNESLDKVVDNIPAVDFLWNKLKYEVLLVNIMFAQKSNSPRTRILPYYYKDLKESINQVVSDFQIDYQFELQEHSKIAKLSVFNRFFDKVKQNIAKKVGELAVVVWVNNVLSLFVTKKGKSSNEFPSWLELQQNVFKSGIKGIEFEEKPNHFIYNEILTILKDQKTTDSLYDKLISSVDFKLIAALQQYEKNANKNLNNLIRYTLLPPTHASPSFSFDDFDGVETSNDINPTITLLKRQIDIETTNIFQSDWWAKNKNSNKYAQILKNMVIEFRKKGGPDSVILAKIGSINDDNEQAYVNEAVQTLNLLLQNEGYSDKIQTFSIILNQKFPKEFENDEEFGVKFYTDVEKRDVDLTYPYTPMIKHNLENLPPLIVRHIISSDITIFEELNNLFDQKLKEDESPEINFAEFWFRENPFAHITIFKYVDRLNVSPTDDDLIIIGIGFTKEDLQNVYEFESVIRMNFADENEQLKQRGLTKFQDLSRFEEPIKGWLKQITKSGSNRPFARKQLGLLFDKFLYDISTNVPDRVNFLMRVGASPFIIKAVNAASLITTQASVLDVKVDPDPQPTGSITQTQLQHTTNFTSTQTQPPLLNIGSISTASDFMRKKSKRGGRRSTRRRVQRRRVPRRKPRIVKRRSRKSRQNS